MDPAQTQRIHELFRLTVPATSTQLAILPDEDKPGWADRDPPAFNYITILVKEYPVSTESK